MNIIKPPNNEIMTDNITAPLFFSIKNIIIHIIQQCTKLRQCQIVP